VKVRCISLPNCNLRNLRTFRGLRKLRDHEEEIDDAAMVQNAEHIINTRAIVSRFWCRNTRAYPRNFQHACHAFLVRIIQIDDNITEFRRTLANVSVNSRQKGCRDDAPGRRKKIDPLTRVI